MSLLPMRMGLLALALSMSTVAAVPRLPAGAVALEAKQADFASATQAADALIAAMRADQRPELLRILGPEGRDLVYSGDRVADRAAHLRLVQAYDAAHHLEGEAGGVATLVVGPEEWSWPIPIVRDGSHWHFDTAAGLQRIIDRRVGRNELNVIEVCRAYVAAQREYAAMQRAANGPREFAQRFLSTPGKHDGLYWAVPAGAAQSPLGPQVAEARAEGYSVGSGGESRTPYHGYYYRILTRQGAHAPGGARDYVIDGHMTAGFALLAYPAKWGDSGIMSFMVNQSGIVFEKNLGPDTAKLAAQIMQFDPDLSWSTPGTP
jgi:hypothetical protein